MYLMNLCIKTAQALTEVSCTQVAGLAVQGVQLLLEGPFFITGAGDDQQTASPAEPTSHKPLTEDLGVPEKVRACMSTLLYHTLEITQRPS